jgi:DNA-binding SARP family transcriptional activator
MEFVILGRTELRVHGQPVDLGAAKQRGLMAILLYHVGTPVRVDTIVDHLWAARRPDNHRANLHSLVSRIRAVLHNSGLPKALVRIPSTGAYRLDVDSGLVDYHRFRRAVTQAREAARNGRHESCVALLTEAIELWRDEPLADLRGALAEHLRRNMKDALLDAYKRLADSQLRLGEFDSMLARLEPILRGHDLDDTLAQYWINALCATDRRAEARTFFTVFRQRFRKALHTEPSIELPPITEMPRPVRVSSGGDRPARAGERPTTAARQAASGPRQLPNDVTDFTGHRELLGELDMLTEPAHAGPNIMVISGMPGAGKTTLAVHWAHRQRHRFPDGQLHLNAGAYGPVPPVEPADALGRFLHALDVPQDRIPAGVEQRRDRLNQLLADRQVLIVLDNVLDSAQVRPLLPTSDTCVTLITSRNRLRGLTVREGVRHVTVPPLPEDACLELLSRVIGGPRTHAEPAALRALARLSGGLPLAVRIIGEHVAARPRARICELVDELSTHLLDCEGEDDDEATLRTVFAWSHNALRTDAAHLFGMLGLYPGRSISPEAAAALTGTDLHHAEQLLNTLAKAHLINHDTARRYRFHDLLRRYAVDRAERDEPADLKEAALRRLLDWFLLSATNAAAVLAPQEPPVPDLPDPTGIEPQTFASDVDAMRWCGAERGNLGAVTRWAAKNGWHRHGWQIPGAVHGILDRYGRQDDVRELQEIALWSAQLDGHQLGQIGTLNNLGTTYFALHDYRRAAANFEASLLLARSIGHAGAETICLHNLASVHLANGDTTTAVRLYHKLLHTWRELGNRIGEASTLHRLGNAHRQMRRYDEAIGYYREALAIRGRIGALREQGTTHGELAALFLETDRGEPALEHCRLALEIHEHTKDDPARCDALTTMADIQRKQGMRRESIRTARRAVALSEDIADSLRRGRALTVLAHALAAAGYGNAADRARTEALIIVQEVADPATRALRQRLHTIPDTTTHAPGAEVH